MTQPLVVEQLAESLLNVQFSSRMTAIMVDFRPKRNGKRAYFVEALQVLRERRRCLSVIGNNFAGKIKPGAYQRPAGRGWNYTGTSYLTRVIFLLWLISPALKRYR